MATEESTVSWWLAQAPAGANCWVSTSRKIIGGFSDGYFSWQCTRHVLSYLTAGGGVFRCDGQPFEVGKGNILAMWPGRIYEFEHPIEGDWTAVSLSLTGSGAPQLLRSCGFSHSLSCISAHDPSGLEHAIAVIRDALAMQDAAAACAILAQLYRLPTLCLAEPCIDLSQADLFAMFESLLDAELGHGVNVNGICQSMQVSRATLYRLVMDHTQLSPQAYIERKRLSQAEDLLCATTYSISSVARICGFSSDQYFCRRFRHRYGTSPGVYRQQAGHA